MTSPAARAAAAADLLTAYRSARDDLERDRWSSPLVRTRTPGRKQPQRSSRRAVGWALDGHIARRLTLLERVLHSDAAAGAPSPPELESGIRHLEAALVPVPRRSLLALGIAAVSTVALALIGVIRAIDARRRLDESIGTANDLVGALAERVLTLDVTQVPEALREIAGTRLQPLAFVVILLASSIYLVLRPFVPAVRVKRLLLDRHDAARLEARALGQMPPDPQLDLVVLALPWLLPLYVGAYMLGDALGEGGARWGQWVGGLLLLGSAGARLAFLARRRRPRALAPDPPAADLLARPEAVKPLPRQR